MNCTCRTKSLRIFVQSLTEFRVTDSAARRTVRFHSHTTPSAFRQTPVRYPTRLFTSTSTAYSPRERREERVDATPKDEENGVSVNTNAEAESSTGSGSAATIPSASDNDVTLAKINGTILEYNPDSIDSLVSMLDRSTLSREKSSPSAEDDSADANSKSTKRTRPKPPVVHSQLKRLKIIKDDGSSKPNPAEEHAARKEEWQIQKSALEEKFPEGWRPRKRLSPDALDGIRALHSQFPEQYTTAVLAQHFEVSAEAIRRILKSKWRPSPEEEVKRQERWFNRGKSIWAQMAEIGKKPPRKWRQEGIVRKPHWNVKKGPRTEYPYVPRHHEHSQHEDSYDDAPKESAHRKFSDSLL
ncbi:hypothetical protein GGS20DRAFT_97783 [Poronia punctata]|nr:hypothetical protein GGS20DRAFT_97783 [Poronia punctata]